MELFGSHGDVCACEFPSVQLLEGSPFCESCGLRPTDFDTVLESTVSRSPGNSVEAGKSHKSDTTSRGYRYTPLDENEIRLLVLHPGAFEDPVHCTILRADTRLNPQFEAVSYTWADEEGGSILCRFIKCGRVQNLLPVTANCEAALRRLRFYSIKRVLWMDAVCIDQQNINERNHQVRLMSKIYGMAQRVLVYLGEGSHNSDLVFKLLSNHGCGMSPASFLPTKDATRVLLGRSWFQRIWVLQEVAMARHAVAICGPDCMPLEALSVLNLNLVQLPLESVDRTVPCVLRLHLGPHDEQRRLWNLLRSSRSCDCKDPRDKLFALRGLTNDVPPNELSVDYSKTTASVYTELTEYLIMQYRTLDVIDLFSTAHNYRNDLASWVPDWSTTENLEPKVFWAPWGDPQEFWKNIVTVTPNLPAPLYARLEVYAIKLGCICRVKHSFDVKFTAGLRWKLEEQAKKMTSPGQKDMLQQTRSKESVMDDGWHDIKKGIFGGDVPHSPAPDFVRCFCANWDPRLLNTDPFIKVCQCLWCYERPSTFQTILNEASMYRNRLFLTEGGSIGLGPENTAPRDIVCSILGTSFQAVLRPFRGGFKYVGKCYVMDVDKVTPDGVTKEDGTVELASLVAWGQCKRQYQRMEYEPVSIY